MARTHTDGARQVAPASIWRKHAHAAADPKPSASWFLRAQAAGAVAAPMLLIVVAFAAVPDSLHRAQIIVPGMERIALALAATVLAHAAYLFVGKRGALLGTPERHGKEASPA